MSKPHKPKKELTFTIYALLTGYLIRANIGPFGMPKRVAAVTTKAEAETEIANIIDEYLQ